MKYSIAGESKSEKVEAEDCTPLVLVELGTDSAITGSPGPTVNPQVTHEVIAALALPPQPLLPI